MRPVRKITAEEENLRLERLGMFSVIRRDPIEPEPVGTIILKAFRVTGYDRDCDGGLMARLENIDRDEEPTGWEANAIGIGHEDALVVTADEWAALFPTGDCFPDMGPPPAGFPESTMSQRMRSVLEHLKASSVEDRIKLMVKAGLMTRAEADRAAANLKGKGEPND